MLMANHLIGFGAAAIEPASVVFCANVLDAVDRTTYTFSSVSFSTARADRRLVAAVFEQGGAVGISSVTIGGVSASQLVGSGGTTNPLVSLWIAAVPTGTSGNVVVQFGAGTANCAIAVWAVYGASSSTAFATATTSAAENPASESLSVPANGVAIAASRQVDNTNAFTWSGLAENFDATLETGRYSGASDAFAAAATATVSANSGQVSRLVAASFAPPS
jgi:hypothetical protein